MSAVWQRGHTLGVASSQRNHVADAARIRALRMKIFMACGDDVSNQATASGPARNAARSTAGGERR